MESVLLKRCCGIFAVESVLWSGIFAVESMLWTLCCGVLIVEAVL